MIELKSSPLVVREWSVIRIGILVVLVIALLGGVVAVQVFRSLQSKAVVSPLEPSPLAPILPSPANLSPPYVRLITKDIFGLKEKVPVEVYLNSGGKETSELDLVLNYNEDVLDIDSNDVKSEEVYQSFDINLEEPGKLKLSLFITPSIGHQPVVADKETKVATLNFTTSTLAQEDVSIDIEFKKGDNSKSSLFLYSKSRQEKANILEAVEGTSFDIRS